MPNLKNFYLCKKHLPVRDFLKREETKREAFYITKGIKGGFERVYLFKYFFNETLQGFKFTGAIGINIFGWVKPKT